MGFINYLYIIDNSICVYPDYKHNFINVSSGEVIRKLESEFNQLFIEHGENKRIILLLDLTKIDINNLGIGIPTLKILIQYLQTNYPEKLNSVIIYNYSEKIKFIIALLKSFVNPEVSAKIIVDRNYQKFIDILLNRKKIKNPNNTELHC
jgi:hypothetical protein